MFSKKNAVIMLRNFFSFAILIAVFFNIQILFASPANSQNSLGDVTSTQGRVELLMGEASLIRLNEPAQLIAMGDTNIADATLVSSRTILLTAKNIGRTNFLAVNSEDEVVKELILIVKEPGVSTIQVRRGNEVVEYVCRQSQGCVERSQDVEQMTPPQ